MPRGVRANKREEGGRKKRIPLGTPRMKLTHNYDVPANKVARWVNDKPGRLTAAHEGGYTLVSDPDIKVGDEETGRDEMSTAVRRRVGVNEDNTPLYAYLMEIDNEYYDEDQAAKEAFHKQGEQVIKEGGDLSGNDTSGRYIPKDGGISIDQSQINTGETY